MPTTSYTVNGMTCAHCIQSVTAALDRLPGVIDVHIDLDSGVVDVEADRPLDPAAVQAAVTEAGYEMADQP